MHAALVMESDPLITVRVNAWLVVPIELVAVMVSLNAQWRGARGVPVSVAVPLPLSVKATPDGRAPDSVNLGVGNPAVVTVKDAGCPTVKVVDAALVMVAAAVRSSVNAWVTVPVALVAVMVMAEAPVPVGVPEMVAVPLPLLTKVTPEGRVPVSPRDGAG